MGGEPAQLPPAGWYPDPDHPELHQRYWDGAGWTDQRAPLAREDASPWILGIGYLGSLLVIPGLMVAAYLNARGSVHTRWVLLLSLAFLALWIVAGILGANDS
ncbi:MAG: DUF2510 domain-containing protein [Solirubrobacterales bacterium]